MPSIDGKSISAKVNHQIAERFTAIAESRGYTTSSLLADFVHKTVEGMDVTPQAQEPEALPDVTSRLYGVALSLVDDLVDEGYPESEIETALTGVRREML